MKAQGVVHMPVQRWMGLFSSPAAPVISISFPVGSEQVQSQIRIRNGIRGNHLVFAACGGLFPFFAEKQRRARRALAFALALLAAPSGPLAGCCPIAVKAAVQTIPRTSEQLRIVSATTRRDICKVS